MRFSIGLATFVVAAAIGSGAMAQSGPTVTAQVIEDTPLWIEVPGVKEFSGVMVARPLQAGDADALGLSLQQFNARLDGAVAMLSNFTILRYVPETDEYLFEVPFGSTENTVASRMLASGNFQYVEPDWTVYPVACPNDTSFASQWHHQAARLNSCAAWDIETGRNTVVVAICDTGIRTTHTDLLLNRYEGYNVPTARWESAGGAITDINGHGTNCTGCAAGNGNNANGISGIGWNLGHRMMRVTDSTNGSASLSNLTTAARLAADIGDKVASVSYSGVNSSTVFTTGTYVRSKGAMLVWAAGNDGVTMTGNRNDDVMIVGASDQNDNIASFSNRGSLVDLVAPGVSVYTTSNAGNTSYAAVSGTSFACPITAGLCGLIWSRNPDLTPAEVEQIIRSTCVDRGTAGLDDIYGYGRISVAAAIAATPAPGGGGGGGGGGGDTTPPDAPTGLTATAGQGQVTLGWTANSEADLAGYRVYRSTTNGSGYVEVTTSAISSTSFTDSGLNAGTTYYFVIRAVDTSGNTSSNSNQASATPTAPPGPVTLFSDGFESGNLTAGGWTVQNTSAAANTGARRSGSWGARLTRSTWMEKSISTTGFNSLTLVIDRRTSGYERTENLYVEWWNGTAWVNLTTVNRSGWVNQTLDLPAAASNQSGFKFRFRTDANANNERADIDNVSLIGLPN